MFRPFRGCLSVEDSVGWLRVERPTLNREVFEIHFMNMSLPKRTGTFLVCTLALAAVGAQPSSNEVQRAEAESRQASSPRWFFNVDGGYVHQLSTSLDEGGDFEVNRFAVRAGFGYQPDATKSVGLGVGYDRNHYHFSGRSGFGGTDPWDAINTIRLGLPIRWGFDHRWTLFALPSIRWNAEEGADWNQSASGGGILGLSYRFNKRLTLGPGLGALTQLEDSPTYFPVLLIRWNLADRWWLSTDEGLGASQGPGLALTYVASDQWNLFLGGRYENFRFRLADTGPNPDGVGEDSGVPIYLGATYRWHRGRSISLISGVKVGGELTLDNSSGHKIADTDYDPSPFVGLSCDVRF